MSLHSLHIRFVASAAGDRRRREEITSDLLSFFPERRDERKENTIDVTTRGLDVREGLRVWCFFTASAV
jgi:hypothetical protein